jgi:tetratricopeptide (TPR) repeat protein
MIRKVVYVSLFALRCASQSPAVHGANGGGLQFIEDDFPAAQKLAAQKKLPIFVDTWAPWCHSCLALREHVFTQSALAKYQDRFVFVAINTELAKSAPFLEKYPVENWPTLFVIDSASGEVALKWAGTGTVEQMEKLFVDGERALAKAAPEAAGQDLVAADRLFGEGKGAQAAAAYGALLKSAPKNWERRARTVESLLYAQFSIKEMTACADLALAESPGLARGPSFANAVVWGMTCAMSIEGDEGKAKASLKALEPLAHEALALEGLLADDRSGLYELLVEAMADRGDKAGSQALAKKWLEFLEGEAGKAPTAAARASFDPHRVGAAIASGQALRAEAALQQTEKEFPDDYNAAARLALIYQELGRFEDARVAIDRAEKKVYGPRSIRIFEIKAGLFSKLGDKKSQRQTLEKAVVFAKALPVSQRPERTIKRLESEISKLP